MSKHMYLSSLLLAVFLFDFIRSDDNFGSDMNKVNDPKSWHWFPGVPEPAPLVHHKGRDMFSWINDTCDNGKLNLTMDWNFSPINYSCYDTARFIPDPSIPSEHHSKVLPPVYRAGHICMYESISYDTNIPMFGNHRPAWAKWGEYAFLPKQRWLHNLEHGAIVMLYHPCLHPLFVSVLRDIVTGCMYRHIISADSSLSKDHPMALVAWGHKLLLSYPSEKLAKEFIKEYARKGPEETARPGYYDKLLINPAKIVSNLNDTELCPPRERR